MIRIVCSRRGTLAAEMHTLATDSTKHGQNTSHHSVISKPLQWVPSRLGLLTITKFCLKDLAPFFPL
jgi:hypothetical protein